MRIKRAGASVARVVNAILPSLQATAEVIEHRRAICAACPHRQLYQSNIPKVPPYHRCSLCNCPIHSKTARANSSCPQHKW